MAAFRWVICSLAISLSSSGFAATSQTPPQEEVELISRIQIGGNYTYALIKPIGEEHSHGNLGGAQVLYEYRPANRFYGAGKVSWKQGDTECSEAKRSLLYIDLQERLGYTFSCKAKESLLSVFSGFGYRHYRQHVRPGSSADATFNSSFFPPFLTEAADIKLEYHELYMPFGFLADYAIKSFCSIGLYFTWMPTLFPTVDIKPLGNAFWALTKTWKNCLVEIPFTFTLTKNRCCKLVVKPTYEYWRDGHSKAETSTEVPLGLPGNIYQLIGCDLNYCYTF